MDQPSAGEPHGAMRWYALGVFTLGYALNIADRYVVSTLIEPIKAEMGLSDTSVGFLTGVSLAIFYVTLGIPLAVLADRANRRNLLAAAVAVWSAMTALCGQAQTFVQLMLARFGVGVGEAGGTPPSASLIADLFGPLQRSLAFSIFALGAPLGAWLGSEFAGRIAEQHGWRAAFTVLGVPGIVLALVILLTLREPVRGRLDGGAPSHAVPRRFKETLSYVWQRSSVFHVIAAGTMLTFWSWGLIWWTPAFLMRSHGLTVGEAGALLGPIHLIGGTGSLVVTAALMYLRAFRDPRRIMRFAALVALVATVPSILVYAGDRSLVVPMLWILIPATYFYIGPLTGVLQNLVPGGMRAQAMAILLFTANIANLVVAPQLLGFASDVVAATTALGADSLRWVLAFTAPAGFWAAWHCWRAEATVREDYQAVIGGGGLT
jgi:predicted MFS family arabinose efflux permease